MFIKQVFKNYPGLHKRHNKKQIQWFILTLTKNKNYILSI